jgi:hypothetical protein
VTTAWSLLFHCTKSRTFRQSRAFWGLAGKLYLDRTAASQRNQENNGSRIKKEHPYE